MTLKAGQFLALVLTALALIPSGAHLFALPNKISLAQEQYLIVQNIYRGWSLFGIVLTGALIANLALAVVLRRRGAPFVLALFAFFCVALTLVIFFVWTYPTKRRRHAAHNSGSVRLHGRDRQGARATTALACEVLSSPPMT
jgi:hypothetical protein